MNFEAVFADDYDSESHDTNAAGAVFWLKRIKYYRAYFYQY